MRLGRELRQRLADILEQRVSDPRLEGLSLIDVRPSPDLTYARVLYRTLGREPDEVAAALDKARPFIRRCLAEGSRFKRVPELDFRLDPSAEEGARIETVLRELAQERERRGHGDSDDGDSEAAGFAAPGSSSGPGPDGDNGETGGSV